MTRKQESLEYMKKYRGITKLEYGMYAECNEKYCGYVTKIQDGYIYLSNGNKKTICCHPTWEMVYYDNPIAKNIIHDFREEMKNEKILDALTTVKQNSRALEYASQELRADKEVVLEAVKSNSWALQFASEELRADKEIVLEAVKLNGWVLQYASQELQKELNKYNTDDENEGLILNIRSCFYITLCLLLPFTWFSILYFISEILILIQK